MQWTIARRVLVAASSVALAFTAPVSTAAEPKAGGTLNIIANPEPHSLNLASTQTIGTQIVGSKIFSGLLEYGFDFTPKPALAESYTVSEDKKTYTFKLQRGVKWHDGKPFTSADVIFSTQTMLPAVNPRARVSLTYVESFDAPDDYTVVFRLKEPFAPFLYTFDVLTAPMMPKHIYEGTDYRTNAANLKPIGTGPFKFEEWQKGSFIRLSRNPDYYKKGRPYLDGVIFHIIPDSASRAIALETQRVDVTSHFDIDTHDVDRLRRLPFLEITTKGYEAFAPLLWIEFNNTRPPMNDKRFRQAVGYAVDRAFIRDNIFGGLGRIASGPINSVTRFYEPSLKQFEFNPSKAKALLDEMGLKPGPNGVRASVEMIPNPYAEVWSRLSEYIRQALHVVGIEVRIKPTDAPGYVQAVGGHNFEISTAFMYQFADPALGVSRSYLTSNIRKGVMFTNTAQYSNATVDELFAKAATAASDAERQKHYTAIQRALVDDMPVVWLLELELPTFINKRFKSVVTGAHGVNASLDEAYLAP